MSVVSVGPILRKHHHEPGVFEVENNLSTRPHEFNDHKYAISSKFKSLA